MNSEEELRAEIERLQAKLSVYEKEEADHNNPNVFVLRGKLIYYKDKYTAWSINGVYIVDALEKFFDEFKYSRKNSKNDRVTFEYHLTDIPMSWTDLETKKIEASLGLVKTDFSHRFSDLTGYLWTDEVLKVGSHDLIKEMCEDGKYLYLRVEVHND